MEAIRRIFYVLVMMLALSGIASASDIKGAIGVIMNNGDIKYGAKVDVYLTTKEVSFPAVYAYLTTVERKFHAKAAMAINGQ